MKNLSIVLSILFSVSTLYATGFKKGKEYNCKVMQILGSDGKYIQRNENNTERFDYAGSLSFRYQPGVMNITGTIKTGVNENIMYLDHQFIYNSSEGKLDKYLDYKYDKPLYFNNETTEAHVIYPRYHSILECTFKQ